MTYPRTGAARPSRRFAARCAGCRNGRHRTAADTDTAAALTALQADPGLPTRGVVALCDFGGSGTGITFVEAGSHQPIAASVRHLDFSGDLIDQAVLAHVVAELSAGGAVDTTSTSAIGSLTHLRAECRAAKERLSSASVTSLPAQLRGFRGDVRLTRTELDDAIAPALAEFVAAVQDGMARSGCAPPISPRSPPSVAAPSRRSPPRCPSICGCP